MTPQVEGEGEVAAETVWEPPGWPGPLLHSVPPQGSESDGQG